MLPGIRFQHLGGTTRLAPDRLSMAYKAQIFNHVLFWKKYLLPSYITKMVRFKAYCALARYLVGVCFFAVAAAVTARSIHPIKGLLSGFLSSRELSARKR